MLFGKKKNENAGLLFSPGTGQVVPIEEVPDQVFAEKMLGDGAAVIIEEGRILAPAEGKLSTVADTLHAYGIETPDGLELLIHVGIDTVKLEGKGFKSNVKAGQKVKKGDLLCEVDLEVLKANDCPLHTLVIVTNMEDIKEINIHAGQAVAGETVMAEYK